MERFVTWIQAVALQLGGPGLFLIAFLDSSFLSLPQINDLLVIWMVTRHPQRLVYYALLATLGSLAGCFVMYYLGRKGGEALLRKRFSEARVARGLQSFQRYGLLAVLVPALLPPPAPFKLFVLMAGVAQIHPVSFATAILIGRGLRYFGEGLLAVWYGEQAFAYLEQNGRTISLALAAAVGAGAGGYFLWRRLRSAGPGPGKP